MKTIVYISLGSNLGDRTANLHEAMRRLTELGVVQATSSFYETEPVEVAQEQPWFLNCVVALATELSPQELLRQALALEQQMGRKRTAPKAPRTIDIDLLFFGDRVIQEPGLTIPHPGIPHRRFVLEPLAEIAPDAVHPVLHQTVRELLAALPTHDGLVRRYQRG